jgi:uncharacterized protein (DUF4415 family)
MRDKRGKADSEFEFPKRYTRVPRSQMRIATEEDMHPRHTKLRVSIYLDQDVVEYFKERARKPQAQPYQTQINLELRRIMEGERGADVDEGIAERIAQRVFDKLKSERLTVGRKVRP